MIKRFLRILRTLSYLKPRQAIYFFIRRALPEEKFKQVDFLPESTQLKLISPIIVENIFFEPYAFSFLNHTINIKTDEIDWRPAEASRLWQYNLHYFDYLREDMRIDLYKEEFVHDWIENNPFLSKPGWEPYTASLRIVNWVMYFSGRPDEEVYRRWKQSLFEQVVWLEKNLELHILANHYFENLKALLFISCYFSGEASSRWRKFAVLELCQQLTEQFLDDGGHYERTPQYHCRMLENCLDVYNLLMNNAVSNSQQLQEICLQTIKSGLKHLNSVVFPDNTLPLLNDTALADNTYVIKLMDYAQRLDIIFEMEKRMLINESDSGYYGYRSQKDMFVIDCGDIGPAYQPGHMHCDFLSYELMIRGRKLIVDSGVYEYEKGDMRDYVRSTKAHNTISVNHDEQSEIWGEFRVARRAKKLNAIIEKKDQNVFFNGAYSGFYHLDGKVIHCRAATVDLDETGEMIKTITIDDEIAGIEGEHLVRSYIHFHPDFDLQDKGTGEIEVFDMGELFATIHIDNGEYALEKSWYCPEFGLKYENPCIEISVIGQMPVKSVYKIMIHYASLRKTH